ncbi:MAG: M20/M25/M40 family metallo-hydrolase [Acidobacteria bacterium]|nr:M20/M25/M40 family metallo-hydrolase [Acidobacteriota bacterium]
MIKPFSLFLTALTLTAAEPDWPEVDRHAVSFLQSYLRIRSVNPPADTREAAALFAGELRRAGLEPRLFASGPGGQTNLLVRLPGRDRAKKPLLLLNHFDVVPVDPKGWTADPFGGIVRDGFIWGRGAMDMKGIGAQQLLALILMKTTGTVPARDIIMLSTADEETNGTLGIRWMIEKHFPEIDAEYVLDEGGFGTRDMLADGKLVFGIAVGEKATTWLRLRARGIAAHGSQPIPENANDILLEAIRKARQLPAAGQLHPVVADMQRLMGAPFASNKYTNAIRQNTVSLTTLTSGVGDPPKVNVIPPVAEATLDCRLLPGTNAQEFISKMKARINDPRVSVELLSQPDDPGASPAGTPLFRAIAGVIRRHHPTAAVTPMLVPHGTDSVKLRLKGITAYGLTPMVLDRQTSTMHSDDERIPVAEYLKGLRIYLDVLRSEF